MSSYERLQREILNVLLEANNGKIGPILLNPDQLEKEVKLLQSNLPSSLRLPTNEEKVKYKVELK